MGLPKITGYRKGSSDLFIERKSVPLIFGHIYEFKYKPTTKVKFHDASPNMVYLDLNKKYDTIFGVNLHFVPKQHRKDIMAVLELAKRRMKIVESDLLEEVYNEDEYEDEVTPSFASQLILDAQDYIADALSGEQGFDWTAIGKLDNPYVKMFAISFRQYKLSGMSGMKRLSYMRSNKIRLGEKTFKVTGKVKSMKKTIYSDEGVFRGGWTSSDTNTVFKIASQGGPWWKHKP